MYENYQKFLCYFWSTISLHHNTPLSRHIIVLFKVVRKHLITFRQFFSELSLLTERWGSWLLELQILHTAWRWGNGSETTGRWCDAWWCSIGWTWWGCSCLCFTLLQWSSSEPCKARKHTSLWFTLEVTYSSHWAIILSCKVL